MAGTCLQAAAGPPPSAFVINVAGSQPKFVRRAMQEWIAERLYQLDGAEGASVPIAARIGRPEEAAGPYGSSWKCVIQVVRGEEVRSRPVVGGDSVQALVLGVAQLQVEAEQLKRQFGPEITYGGHSDLWLGVPYNELHRTVDPSQNEKAKPEAAG
jgi:hypothetical protein